MKFFAFVLFSTLIVMSSKAQTWVWAKSAGSSLPDMGNSIAKDANGNIYVTGYFTQTVTFGSTTLTSAGGDDIFIVKYDAAGNVIWAKNAGGTGTDHGNSIAADANGNAYITGAFLSSSISFGSITLTNAGGNDIFIAKYDASGNPIWASGAGGALGDIGFGITVDNNGNSYLTGSFISSTISFGSTTLTNAGSSDIFIAKYNSSGTATWAISAGGIYPETGNSIAADANGNVYITGYFNSPSINFGSITLTNASGANSGDFFIVKINSSGLAIWANRAGETSNEEGVSIAIDANGNSHVIGRFQSSSVSFGSTTLTNAGSWDVFTVKYDASGNVSWAKGAGGIDIDLGKGVSVDANGNCTITGGFLSPSISFGSTTLTNAGSYDIYVAQYDSLGNANWAVSVGGTASDQGYSIVTDENGNNYLTGYFSSNPISFGTITLTNAGSADIFVAKLGSPCSLPPQPGTISGNTSPCSGSSQTYSVSPVSGATSYTWTLPTGWAGTSTTNSITTTVGSTGGNISVVAVNSCGNSTASTLAITVSTAPAQPGTISGNTSPCSGSSQTYSVAPVSGATSYTWTLPSGWSGTSTTNSITTTVGSSGGNISVVAVNSCGNSTASTIAVTVSTAPAQPGAITGNTSPCSGSSQTYSISPVSAATSYQWTFPSGWSGSSTTNSITTTVGTTGGNISVVAVNSCGNSPAQTLAVTVSTAPSQPGVISGNTSPCSGSSQIYSVSPVSGATTYTWTLPSGWTGTSTTNSITTTVGSGGGNISVVAVNSCGNSTAQTLAVTVSTAPAQPGSITGNNTPFVSQSLNYSITAVTGATGYNWSVNTGGTITAGQNTTAVTVNWTGAGNSVLSVNATNSCGISTNQTMNLTVSVATAIIDPANGFRIRLAPNPTSGNIYLKVQGAINKQLKIELIDLAGQSVYTREQKTNSNDLTQYLDLHRLPAAMYQVKITIDKKVYLRTIVKI